IDDLLRRLNWFSVRFAHQAQLPNDLLVQFGQQIEVLTNGLAVGSPFSGTAAELPIASEWKNGNFWAVSIDLPTIVQLLRAAALGSGKGRKGNGS
ncbi:MAG TPA: hypothetical protein VLX28_08860, partial [Thermoanaerobaculia bacterium]|nr:hypothetical protein [Thermoanaerobaculia bacterium]